MLRLPTLARRALLAVVALTAATVGTLHQGVTASALSDVRWIGSWTTAPQGVVGAPSQYSNQTLRLIVRTTAGGNQVRVRLSNEIGTQRIVIGSAHIALRSVAESIDPTTDRALTFGGVASITVPAGAPVLSDPVELDVPPLSELAVSIYLPHPTPVSTVHLLGLQTSYVSAPDSGDLTGAATLPTSLPIGSWPLLTGVHVKASKRAGAIVVLGDSITDGVGSSVDANRRWPDMLSERLQVRPNLDQLAVLNQGIIGNRLLRPGTGAVAQLLGAAASRGSIATLSPSLAYVYLIVLLGINDIGVDPGQVVVSDDVWRQIRGRQGFRFERLGNRDLKDVGLLDLYLVTLDENPAGTSGSTTEARSQHSQKRKQKIRSIAVLPFADLSVERDQEHFSDGVAEEILNALSKIRGLHVRGEDVLFCLSRNEPGRARDWPASRSRDTSRWEHPKIRKACPHQRAIG